MVLIVSNLVTKKHDLNTNSEKPDQHCHAAASAVDCTRTCHYATDHSDPTERTRRVYRPSPVTPAAALAWRGRRHLQAQSPLRSGPRARLACRLPRDRAVVWWCLCFAGPKMPPSASCTEARGLQTRPPLPGPGMENRSKIFESPDYFIDDYGPSQ